MSFRSPKTSPISPEHESMLSPSSSPLPSSSPSLLSKNILSIGSLWTSEITLLKSCGTAFEISLCLKRIDEILQNIDPHDRIKFCKSDFEYALNELKHHDIYFTDKLLKSIAILRIKYFNEVCWLCHILISIIFSYIVVIMDVT